MGEEHLKKTFKINGRVGKRHYVPPNPRHYFKEGEVVRIGSGPCAAHYKLTNTRVEVLARYFIWNYGYKNYGMVVRVLDGPRKDKILHIPSVVPKKGERTDALREE